MSHRPIAAVFLCKRVKGEVSASAIPNSWKAETACRELRTDEVEQLVKCFGPAAAKLADAGIEGRSSTAMRGIFSTRLPPRPGIMEPINMADRWRTVTLVEMLEDLMIGGIPVEQMNRRAAAASRFTIQ